MGAGHEVRLPQAFCKRECNRFGVGTVIKERRLNIRVHRMIRCQRIKHWLGCLTVGLFLGLGLSVPAFSVSALAPMPGSNEVLEAEPVATATPTDSGSAQTVPAEDVMSARLAEEFGQERVLFPYYFSAYIPRMERTEVNLGLFLSQNPGIDVAVSWAVMQDMMVSARMAALGASNTVDAGLRYAVLPEQVDSSKPAIAVVADVLVLNHRTLGEPRETIFRGSRVRTGVVFSKDLGALARALQASESAHAFMQYFRIHAEALVEYQSGRRGTTEEAHGEFNAGAKAALEAMVIPGELYVTLAMDTIPDWIDTQNYFLGVRYFSQPDLAFDVVSGKLQNGYGVHAAISWIF